MICDIKHASICNVVSDLADNFSLHKQILLTKKKQENVAPCIVIYSGPLGRTV